MSVWRAVTTDRNDFYPWVQLEGQRSFRLYISEVERLFMFPMYFNLADRFWTEGNTTKINLGLHNSHTDSSLNSKYITELNRTYYNLKNN